MFYVISWKRIIFVSAALFVLVGLISPPSAQARAIDDVQVKILSDGYELTLSSLFSFQYSNIMPQGKNRKFYIQLKTLNYQILTTNEINSIKENASLSWDNHTGIPLEGLQFDGGQADRPSILIDFTEDVALDVRSSADLKSLIITIKTENPPVLPADAKKTDTGATQEIAKDPGIPAEAEKKTVLETAGLPQDEAGLMDEAKDALAKAENDRAVEIYLKVLLTAREPVKQKAQELLGLARERNGQFAHAAAEYKKYLVSYPQGADADRVRQRLAGLVTAEQSPQEALKEPSKTPLEEMGGTKKGQPAKRMVSQPGQGWSFQHFGSFSQFLYWDKLKSHGGTSRLTVNNLTNDLDLSGKWKSRQTDLGFRFTGGTTQAFVEGGHDEDRVSALYVDVKAKDKGLFARVGRQSLSTGGVLGRFDGIHVSNMINKMMKFNAVFGFPVESVRITDILTKKKFIGGSIDWGPYLKRWNFNTFFINQNNNGYTDRRAIGGEARYFDATKALFSLIDYDVYFKQINIVMFNGHWTLPTKTTFNLSGDYRKSPLLMTTNAIQGMGASEISDLKDRFSTKELRQLSLDRTSNSKSLSAGISQDIMENFQWNLEGSVSIIEGTLTSGGVDGTETVDHPDYTTTTGFVLSRVFKDDDALISNFSFTDSSTAKDYSVNVNVRYPLTPKVRVTPKLTMGYRDTKQSTDHRWLLRPTLHFNYSITRSIDFEIEGGVEWITEKASGANQRSTEGFITTGYRISF